MKHIAVDNIVSASADSEHSNFPATRVMDDHPKRVWKTSDNISLAKLTVGVVGGVTDIMIAGTNAESATVSAEDPNEMEWGDDDEWGTSGDTDFIINGDFSSDTVWVKGEYWGITGGYAFIYGLQTADSTLYQAVLGLVEGKKYKFKYTITYTGGGTLRFNVSGTGENEDSNRSATGTYTGTFVYDGVHNTMGMYASDDFDGIVDDISLLEVDEWANTGFGSITAEVIQNSGANSLWLTLSEAVTIPSDLTITLQAPASETLYAGVVRAGVARTYSVNPDYGLRESRKDYSIEAENSNGSRYYKKRDIVRTFDLKAFMSRTQAQLLIDTYDDVGKLPMAWKLTDIDSSDWVVFGRFTQPPVISHDHPEDSIITWAITEVL